jgi:hypothetical protein
MKALDFSPNISQVIETFEFFSLIHSLTTALPVNLSVHDDKVRRGETGRD